MKREVPEDSVHAIESERELGGTKRLLGDDEIADCQRINELLAKEDTGAV